MPIIETKTLSRVVQQDSRVAIQVEYTTHINDRVKRNHLVPSGVDVDTFIEDQKEGVLEQLKQKEIDAVETMINIGTENIPEIVSNLKYLPINEALRAVVYRGVSLTSVYRLVNLEAIKNYTKVNYTNTELSEYTQMPLAIIELYYQRIETALTCKDALSYIDGSAYNG